MIKKLASLLLPFVIFHATACNRGQEQQQASGPRVAMVFKTLNNPFFIDMQRSAEEAARRLNVNVTVQAAEREIDVEKQMQIIENLIQTQVDAICVYPLGEPIPETMKGLIEGVVYCFIDCADQFCGSSSASWWWG